MTKSFRTDVTANVQLPPEDALLIRKITLRVVPFLFICYVVLFLDRINIGFAQLQMKHDFGFTDTMYGLGAAMFYAGYVLCELPSNMLLARFGARKTFSRIMLLCGIVSTCMIFVSTSAAYYVLRFMLGVFEAGSFPGILLYITYWFPANRRAAMISVFIAGVALAGVVGGLFSGWIMRDMAGVLGLFGWQWMFAFEGLPAVVLGLIAWWTIVDSPAHATWLSEAERGRLNEMLNPPEPEEQVRPGLGPVVANPKVYLFAFVYFSLTCASLTLNFWLPLIIRDFGVRDLVLISLFSAIPNAIGVVGLVVISKHSDRTNERRRHFAFCAIGGAAAFGTLTLHVGSLALMLGCLSVACALIYAALPIFWAVPSTQFPKHQAAPSIALISSIGITSGIVSPWAIGVVRTHTGTIDDAIYILMVLLVLSSVALLAGVRSTNHGRPRSSA
ncbi:MFS transporter [Paraburkholderia sp. BCC1884]|uniref:MFS transporter n=1 Tax=Paraburkholderia sp. BCC1884 TaxID=2562668 RepID=UPI001184542E|nr:MFS transporter [Paraburkholderia sp. BCC1884]